MTSFSTALRDRLAGVLDWEDAHVTFDKAVDGIPEAERGVRPEGFPLVRRAMANWPAWRHR